MKRALLLPFALLLGCSGKPQTSVGVSAATPAGSVSAAHFVRFADAVTGIRFDYPDVWKPFRQGEGLPFAAFVDAAGQPRASFVFSPKGNVYERTNLEGLVFSYTEKAVADEAACTDIALRSAAGTNTTRATSHAGIPFTEASGRDAAMCHSVAETVSTHFESGRCLVFERDVDTICPGVKNRQRELTAAENAALQRHLDAIMETIRLR